MRRIMAGLLGLCLAAPAAAQDLGQVGRLLGDQLLPRTAPQQPADQNYERDRAYEQGRRDAEADRRARGSDRDRRDDDRRRASDQGRQRSDESLRRQRDSDRQRVDQNRATSDQRRARRQSDDDDN